MLLGHGPLLHAMAFHSTRRPMVHLRSESISLPSWLLSSMQQMKNIDEKMLCRIFRGLCGEDEPWHYRKTAMTEVIELISAEASQLRDFLAHLGPEAWASPSACAGWVIGDVVAHLTQGARTWSETITRAIAGDFNPTPAQTPT